MIQSQDTIITVFNKQTPRKTIISTKTREKLM